MTSPSHDPSWQRPGDTSSGAGPSRPSTASLVDPEDDMPSDTYGGDFETTAIPQYGAAPSATGYSLLNDPEPLPYVAPHDDRPPMIGPAAIEPDDYDAARRAGRRGTQDLGLLLLRAGFGALLIAHGLQKAFGWWGGSGLGSFGDGLANLGYQHAELLTYLAAGTEIAAGVLLVLGLFTPLAAAAALAYLVNGLLAAVVTQQDSGRVEFFLPDGHEFQLTLIVIAAAIILIGPGRYGFDAGRGWARRPFIGSFVALLLGVGGGIAVWVLLNGTNPLA
ncbi:DoxX family protein [[Mycobacterium] burgundiense]|uniref:DoxX family membrane protein n=1 Tax=[Mycobacterium] burgundiense TaxID=3064286 RepID=A0ABM9LY42_9MYCO|nr:DoxX family membrane protein [Mycolicibacterium sp. MU0053]CAJ1506740.1 DoxX family membrane protein [Mycolicibacterium sp. MU0053]